MKHTKLLLGALAIGSIAVACNNPPAATTDAGTDGGGGGDSGRDSGATDGGSDAGNDAFVPPADANVPQTCAGYCAQITSACTGVDAQYADEADCMAQCTALAWPAGTDADMTTDTLGCRIYHSIAAGGDPSTHCIHAGATGGNACGTTFRSDTAVEVVVTGTAHAAGYVRVDRMGMPAVATALIGTPVNAFNVSMPTTPIPLQAANPTRKNDYNDGNPDADAGFAFGPDALSTLGYLHAALDSQLRMANLTPCNMRFTPWPPSPLAAGAPYCAVQGLDGNPAHPVAGLILPDTLRLDPTSSATFPNGRALADPVIDITLAVLLLSTEHSCAPSLQCAGRPMGACTAATGCEWQGSAATGSCSNLDCEAITDATTCAATVGCGPNVCGTGTTACNAGSLAALPLNVPTNDEAFETAFPYVGLPHP